MTKKNPIFIIIILFFGQKMFGQKMCDCDSIYRNKGWSGYCVEYLSLRWLPVQKNKAQFKRYTLYQNGRKSREYPFSEYLPKKDRIIYNDKEITSVDTVTFLHGLYRLKDKRGRIYEEIYYENGNITKHVVKGVGIWQSEKKGKFVSEIVEYDYSTTPFRKHYLRYNSDGTVKNNFYTHYGNGVWHVEDTDNFMTSDPLDFKGVPGSRDH